MEEITKRDYFAIKILQKLMGRRNEPGYTEESAIRDYIQNLSGVVVND